MPRILRGFRPCAMDLTTVLVIRGGTVRGQPALGGRRLVSLTNRLRLPGRSEVPSSARLVATTCVLQVRVDSPVAAFRVLFSFFLRRLRAQLAAPGKTLL